MHRPQIGGLGAQQAPPQALVAPVIADIQRFDLAIGDLRAAAAASPAADGPGGPGASPAPGVQGADPAAAAMDAAAAGAALPAATPPAVSFSVDRHLYELE